MIRTFPLGFSNIFWKSESNKLCQRIQRCSFVVSFYFIVFSTRCFRWKLPDADFLSALKFHGKEKGFFVLFRSPSPLAGTFIGLHPPLSYSSERWRGKFVETPIPISCNGNWWICWCFRRSGVRRVQYLPYQIRINQTNHCIQPTPMTNPGWVDVWGKTDRQSDRQTIRQINGQTDRQTKRKTLLA